MISRKPTILNPTKKNVNFGGAEAVTGCSSSFRTSCFDRCRSSPFCKEDLWEK